MISNPSKNVSKKVISKNVTFTFRQTCFAYNFFWCIQTLKPNAHKRRQKSKYILSKCVLAYNEIKNK
jgi:hypothetical protein